MFIEKVQLSIMPQNDTTFFGLLDKAAQYLCLIVLVKRLEFIFETIDRLSDTPQKVIVNNQLKN